MLITLCFSFFHLMICMLKMLNLCCIFHLAGPCQYTRATHFLASTCTLPNDMGSSIYGCAIRFQIQVAGKLTLIISKCAHFWARCMCCCCFFFQVLVFIAIILNGANLYGYIKCNYGSNTNLNTAASDFVRKQVFRSAFDFMSKPSQPSTTGIVWNKYILYS